jgi:serine/threonine-protein kinase
VWIDAFVARRYPVTHREWIAFLDDLVAQGREEEALRHVPRERAGAGGVGALLYGRRPDGGFALAPDEDGAVIDADFPVSMIDWRNACAFAAWEAARTGQPWRLPGELEFEKAGRGADGRMLPWGDHFDPTWACCFESHTSPRPNPARRAEFPDDVSPYGVRHLAGNMRSWVANVYRLEGPLVRDGRAVPPEESGALVDVGESQRGWRGGGFLDYSRSLRLTGRAFGPPSDRFSRLGCRLMRPWRVRGP